MTRFARAKGSKASNAREPEEATPWSEMVRAMPQGVVQGDVEDLDEVVDDRCDDSVTAKGQTSDEAEDDIDSSSEEAEPTAKPDLIVADEAEETGPKKKKRVRKKDKCLNCKQKGHMKMDCPELTEERRKELRDLVAMKVRFSILWQHQGHHHFLYLGRLRGKAKERVERRTRIRTNLLLRSHQFQL